MEARRFYPQVLREPRKPSGNLQRNGRFIFPPLLPGEAAPVSGNPLFLTRVQPTVTIGGQAARVLFSGMAPGWVGLWQINAEVPATVTPGSAVPMTVTAGGITSNTVTIAVV